jgi:lipoprotein-anchoring transpeptidase ErfK/SrfK
MSAPIFGSFGRIGTALLAALTVCILPVGNAHAQFLFGPPYSSSWGNQVSFGHNHGDGNHHSVQTRARQSPFRSGARKGTAITVSFRHKHRPGLGNHRFVQAPTRARQSPFRSGARKGTAITVSFRHKHRPEHNKLGSFRHKHRPEHANLVSLRHKGQHRHAKSELTKKAKPQDAVNTELAKKAEPQDTPKTELAKRAEPQDTPKTELAKKAEPQDAVKTELAKKGSPKGPLQIIISIADQRISLYDNGALIARSSVSTGVQGYPTPLGIFSVISKERWHRSNIYSAAPMPYMQRITWSGIALHAGVLPGYPASHGCIRLSNDFAIRLWHLTERGTRVIIAPEDVQPVEIANRHLSVPKPKVPSESETAAVAGSGTIARSSAPAALVRGDELAFATLRVAPQKVVPISVFVSRKSSRLFVRKGLTPLFDIPVEIHSPKEPLGTHVFTAMEPQKDSASRWTVVSMPRAFSHASAGTAQERKEPGEPTAEATSPVSLPDSADAALDRIEIPRDVVEQISELLTPGSSLIISDYGMSSETREDTDFIVLAH